MSISIRYRLHENITILSSLKQELFIYTTSKKFTDLLDAERDEGSRRPFQRLNDSLNILLKIVPGNSKTYSQKQPEFKPQICEIIEPSSSLLLEKCQIQLTEAEIIITLPSTFLRNTEVSIAKFSLDKTQITSPFLTQISDTNLQTLVKTTYHPHPPSLSIILVRQY